MAVIKASSSSSGSTSRGSLRAVSGYRSALPTVTGQAQDSDYYIPEATVGGELSKYKGLGQTITRIYNNLRAAGKNDEAFRIRDAAERFSRTGSSLGVNAFGRSRELNKLKGEIMAASRLAEARVSAAEVNALKDLGRLRSAEESTAFGQEMARAGIFNQQQQLEESRSQAESHRVAAPRQLVPTVRNQNQRVQAPRAFAPRQKSAMSLAADRMQAQALDDALNRTTIQQRTALPTYSHPGMFMEKSVPTRTLVGGGRTTGGGTMRPVPTIYNNQAAWNNTLAASQPSNPIFRNDSVRPNVLPGAPTASSGQNSAALGARGGAAPVNPLRRRR